MRWAACHGRAMSMDWQRHNREAWDQQVEEGSEWTVPVSSADIARARAGELELRLTPTRVLPRDWLPSTLSGVRTLCLAGGGGQQGPLLAAAGASVTVFDLSPRQLAQDRAVADREGLALTTVEGEMSDLSTFADGSFDLVVFPCASLFVPDVRPVWRECVRVLRHAGVLLSGFVNPLYFLFDDDLLARGELRARYTIPYADISQRTLAELDVMDTKREPLCFGHTLEDQLAGQLDAGFVITGFYEDRWDDKPLDARIATFGATRAQNVRLERLAR